MTVRLVSLMSVVLLLSLAAFGLLVNHYQQNVMDELGRTVSSVGRATLRTLESRGEGAEPSVWVEAEPGSTEQRVRQVRRVVRGMKPAVAGGGREEIVVIERISTSAEELSLEGASQPPEGAPSVPDRFVIDVNHVRTEPLAGGELILKIPRLAASPAGEGEHGNVRVEVMATEDRNDDGELVFSQREELELPISVNVYDRLFDSLRTRSALVFFGVFIVGTALSAGLATRFTQPIRTLDAGIRRVSAGDLDVTVPVRGQDEMGRLSRAFNDMIGRLRSNRQREKEMVRREKLSALGRLAAGVAHDVRNPLHSIGLTLDHLNDTVRPVDPAERAAMDKAVGIIRGEIRRLDRLVGGFLEFAKTERHERAPLDLGGMLRDTARLVQKESERQGVDLVLRIDENAGPVPVVAESLRSAVLNLVLNSLQAMPGGGRLTLGLKRRDDGVAIEISDTGEGIPEDDRERVFDFAYTTRDGGTGLGLAMVHHCVVDEHGGRIDLTSRPGEGTTVRLELPSEGPA